MLSRAFISAFGLLAWFSASCLAQPSNDPAAEARRIRNALQQAYGSNWRDAKGPSVTVTASNGQVYRAFTNGIVPWGGALGIELPVYVEAQPAAPFDPDRMLSYYFDCHGDYRAEQRDDWHYAPPNSVAAELSAIACKAGPPHGARVVTPGGQVVIWP